MERRFLSGTIASLLVNVHVLSRARGASDVPPVVIVDRRAVSHYLNALAAVRAITPVDVIRVTSDGEMTRWVAMLSSDGSTGAVIVGRDFYMRHYGSLTQLRAHRRLVVA